MATIADIERLLRAQDDRQKEHLRNQLVPITEKVCQIETRISKHDQQIRDFKNEMDEIRTLIFSQARVVV